MKLQAFQKTEMEDLLRLLPESIMARDLKPLAKKSDVTLEYWHVETLLNQASDILDRCLAVKREVDSNWIKAAQLALEISNDEMLLLRDKMELSTAKYQLSEQRNRSDFENNRVPRASFGETRDLADLNSAGILKNKVDNGYAAASGSGVEAARNAVTRNGATMELMEHKEGLSVLSRQITAAAAREISLVEINDRLTQNSQQKKLLASQGGALDYLRKSEILTEFQLVPDLFDAYERCRAAAIGLDLIYQRSPKEFPVPAPFKGPGIRSTWIEELWAWANSAIRWLLRFSHREQLFTLSTPVKKPGLNKVIKFTIDPTRIAGYSHVRVRGASVLILDDESDPSVYEGILKPPISATFDFGTGKSLPIDQSGRFCTLGRICSTQSPRGVEVAGTVSLFNTSPIGRRQTDKWSILLRPVSSSAAKSKPQEAIIELQLIGRTKA